MKFKYILILSALIGQILSLSAREVTSFNEGWLFKRGPFSQDPVKVAAQWNADWETVNLPHTWNAKDMQVKADAFYEGVGYYRKTQFFGNELKGKRVFLRFEGVGANTEVYVNGKLVGMHRGAYSAFAFEIGTALKLGAENEIMVKADNASRSDVIPVNHNLFGVYGGIYHYAGRTVFCGPCAAADRGQGGHSGQSERRVRLGTAGVGAACHWRRSRRLPRLGCVLPLRRQHRARTPFRRDGKSNIRII